MVPQVNATARDIKFDIQNSCNCCDCDEDEKVYVNSKGHVEKFDPKKAQDEREALKRSISHLRAIIEARESLYPRNSLKIERTLSESVGEITEDSPRHMSKAELQKIKKLLQSPIFNGQEIEEVLTKREND